MPNEKTPLEQIQAEASTRILAGSPGGPLRDGVRVELDAFLVRAFDAGVRAQRGLEETVREGVEDSMSDLVWILEKGAIQEGGEILGVWAGPDAQEDGERHFHRIAWTVNRNPLAVDRHDQTPGGQIGTAYVSGAFEWLALSCYASGYEIFPLTIRS